MATYKVLQDIEAEDKILGPLTLRQFIYALIAAFLLYISFICITKGASYLLVILLPPALFTGFFAFPFGKDQPTEVWALAKIRFLFKPRKRIWDQSGMKELVTITVPKKIERVLTNGLSPNEVESRLKALANTIDSRGWAVKNVNVNLYSQPDPYAPAASDRLIDLGSMPQEVPNYDVQAADDMLDETSNPIAQQFAHMINASSQNHRQKIIDQMNDVRAEEGAKPTTPPNDYWFMNQPTSPANLPDSQAMFTAAQVVQPGATDTAAPAQDATATEEALAAQLRANHVAQYGTYGGHMRVVQPLNAQQPNPVPVPSSGQTQQSPAQPPKTDNAAPLTPVTAPPDPAILSLANNNDLNVATLAREAQKARNPDQPPEDEVVISLR